MDTRVAAGPATPGDSWPRSLRAGAVAASGCSPSMCRAPRRRSAGHAVLVGHFALVVLASPGSRVQLALTEEQQPRAAGTAQAAVQVAGVAAVEPPRADARRGMTGDRTLLRE